MKVIVYCCLLFVGIGVFLILSPFVHANSSDAVGFHVRLDSTLLPIPAGFVIESVNVREVSGEEIEELNFISDQSELSVFSIHVYRRRSLFEAKDFKIEGLLHFGDQAIMTECVLGPFSILMAEYQDPRAHTKVVISRDNYQVLLLGSGSPSLAVAMLEEIADFDSDGRRVKFLNQLRNCLL